MACCPYAFIIFLVSMRLIPRAEIEALLLVPRLRPGMPGNGRIRAVVGRVRRALLGIARSVGWNIVRRLPFPTLCALWLCFCRGMGEADLAHLLSPPGARPLPIRIYNVYHFGEPGEVAVLSLVLLLMTLAAVGSGFLVLWLRGTRRRREATQNKEQP